MKVTAVLWITHDLSKEYQLTLQQQRSTDILNLINAIFVETDFAYRLKYINKKAEDFLGKSQNELLNQVLWDIIPTAIGSKGYDAITTACEERQKVETEYFSEVFKRWVFLSATPSPDGVIIFMS